MSTIKVHVVKFKARENLMMRYLDPETGKRVVRSTGTSRKREAERVAAKWEAELQEGRYQKPNKMSWEDFRAYHCIHVLTGMKVSTIESYNSTLNMFEKLANPRKLIDATSDRVTAFVTAMRQRQNSPATIAHHLRHLKAVLRWAHQQGLLAKLPIINMPKQAKGMRGRPVTAEEFDRMLSAVPKAIKARPNTDGRRDVEQWRFYLWGLWESGLRLGESLSLRWDDTPGAIVVELAGRRPMLRIPAEAEKGGTHRLLPITPGFSRLLASVPRNEQRGYVFGVPDTCPRTVWSVSRRIVAIGTSARVVVKESQKGARSVRKYASAHDLRRSFGFRWSRKLMPAELREIMRHSSVETTMKFYVGQNAEATADKLWATEVRSKGQPEGQPAPLSQAVSEGSPLFL